MLISHDSIKYSYCITHIYNKFTNFFLENHQLYHDPTDFGGAGFLLHNDVKVLIESDELSLPKHFAEDNNYMVENK